MKPSAKPSCHRAPQVDLAGRQEAAEQWQGKEAHAWQDDKWKQEWRAHDAWEESWKDEERHNAERWQWQTSSDGWEKAGACMPWVCLDTRME